MPDINKEDLENVNNDKEVFKEKLATEFPLSGGETDEDLEHVLGTDDEEDTEEKEDTEEDEAEFKRRLSTEFPLSGGETEED